MISFNSEFDCFQYRISTQRKKSLTFTNLWDIWIKIWKKKKRKAWNDDILSFMKKSLNIVSSLRLKQIKRHFSFHFICWIDWIENMDRERIKLVISSMILFFDWSFIVPMMINNCWTNEKRKVIIDILL